MGDEKPPVTVTGDYTGDSIHGGYSVVHDSASLAADNTANAVPDITAAQTAMVTALESAEGALPTEFADALARLKTLRGDHSTDLTTIHTFADGCVTSVRSCLDIYETTSADQVAATQRFQSKLDFDHPGLLPMTLRGINSEVDNGISLPSHKPGYSGSTSYEHSRTGDATDHTTTTSLTRSLSQNGITTSENGYTTSHTSRGITDTMSYYTGSHRGGGVDTTVSGSRYTVTQGGHEVFSTSDTGLRFQETAR